MNRLGVTLICIHMIYPHSLVEQIGTIYPVHYIPWSNVHICHSANRERYSYSPEVFSGHLSVGAVPPAADKSLVCVPPGSDSDPDERPVALPIHCGVQMSPRPPWSLSLVG